MVENAPPMVREWGKGLELRAVFGLAALREKVLLSDAGIDDAWVEALKLDLMRSGRFGPLHPNNRPRVTQVDDKHLVFGNIKVQRTVVDDMMNEPVAWVRAHSSVMGGPYVDVGRLLIPGAP